VTEPVRAVRASDADRERTAAQLSAHAAAGRLTPQELDERVEAAYAARTHGELDHLVADLPPAPASPEEAADRRIARARMAHRAGGAAITILVCIGVWLATGATGYFWPIWVIIGMGVGLANEAWRLFGPGAGLSDEELSRKRDDRRLGRGAD
jgi:hypothetical protein